MPEKQFADVDILAVQVGERTLCAGEEQKIANKIRQPHGFFQTGAQNFAVFVHRSRAGQGDFRLAADIIHRSSQVVGNIGGESGDPLERLFQADPAFG